MNANERRADLIKFMEVQRKSTATQLADMFNVKERTIHRDIVIIAKDIPIITIQGNGGGVKLEDWYHPHKNILSKQHSDLLERLVLQCDDTQQKKLIRQLLIEFGAPSYRQKYENVEE